ncbi:MAG: GNAT family N-acetyltransferase [Propionivibrio sp.]
MHASSGINWHHPKQAIASRHTGHGQLQVFTPLRPFLGHLPQQRGYHIRPVRSEEEQQMANALVRRMYAWRGYDTATVGFRPNDPNRVTLVAWQFDEIVATLTLGRDAADGLLADALYGEEIDTLRKPGRVVCEVTRLAVDPDFTSKDLLTSLLRIAHRYGVQNFKASDVVMEVNPRHVRYYERGFGFRQLGKQRHCERVDAPAVLLHQQMEGFVVPENVEALRARDVTTSARRAPDRSTRVAAMA